MWFSYTNMTSICKFIYKSCILFSLFFFLLSCNRSLLSVEKGVNSISLGRGISSHNGKPPYRVDRLPKLTTPTPLEIALKRPSPLLVKYYTNKRKAFIESPISDSLTPKFFLLKLSIIELDLLASIYADKQNKPSGLIISNSFLIPENDLYQIKIAKHIELVLEEDKIPELYWSNDENMKQKLLNHDWIKIKEEIQFICYQNQIKNASYQFIKRPHKCSSKTSQKKIIKALIK